MVVRVLRFWTGATVWSCDRLLMRSIHLVHAVRLMAFKYTRVDLVWYIYRAAWYGAAILGCALKYGVVGIILVGYWLAAIPYAFALWFSIIFY